MFEKLATEAIKREGRYTSGKLKTWKERRKINFYGEDISHGMYCSETAALKIAFDYKQGKNYHPQVYVEECQYVDAENQQCNMISDGDDEFFEL